MNDLSREMEWIFKREAGILNEAEKYLAAKEYSNGQLAGFYSKLVYEYKRLLKQNVKLVTLGDAEQKYLFQIQSEIKNILDNTGQGIFTTDENLYIDSKYSAECARIFGQSLENKKFSDVIRAYNSEDTIALIEQVLCPQIFFEHECSRLVMLMLLPEEVYYKDKTLLMVCRIISDESKEAVKNRFLFLLTDITEKKQLENQMQEKQKLINSIIKIVSDNSLFKNCAKAFADFLSEGRFWDFPSSNEEELREVLRKIHTFRGDFSIFELDELVNLLQKSEENLAKLLQPGGLTDGERAVEALDRDNLKVVFERSIERLSSIIGNSFFEFGKEEVSIDKKTLEILIKRLSDYEKHSDPELNSVLEKLYKVNLRNLLKSYPEYTVRLAERNGKSLKAFSIEGPECLLVDEKRFSPFSRSLVHVFRNAVVHGIEEPSIRLQEGKEDAGCIGCRIWEDGGSIFIEVSDDGQGIDVEKVKKKAIELNRCQTIDMDHSQALMEVLFSDGFSTANEPDQYSGMGEGLADVQYELKLTGGKAYLKTSRGAGTVLGFVIPKT